MFFVFVLRQFILYPTEQLCDKIYRDGQFGFLPLIEYGLSAQLTIALRKLSHDRKLN